MQLVPANVCSAKKLEFDPIVTDLRNDTPNHDTRGLGSFPVAVQVPGGPASLRMCLGIPHSLYRAVQTRKIRPLVSEVPFTRKGT